MPYVEQSLPTGRGLLIAIPFVVVVAIHLFTGTTPCNANPTDSLDARLAAVDRLVASIDVLTADFEQLKHTPLLRKPLKSSGTLQIRGDMMRWDTTAPTQSVMIIDASELRLYFQEQSLLEIYPLSSRIAQLASSPLPRLDEVRKNFTISEQAWTGTSPIPDQHMSLRLEPIDVSLREHLVEVRILIDVTTGCVIASEIHYPDHERLEITFRNVELNVRIEEHAFTLDLPADTTISHPLGNGESNEPVDDGVPDR